MRHNEITIERIEELRLTPEREDEIAKLLDEVFSVDFEGRSFFQNRHHCRFMAYQENELVGHLAIAYRAIQMGERRIDVVGIGEVAVATNARKQGIATQLVQCALEEARLAHADFATLFGEEALYAKAGFIKAPNVITLIEMEGAKTSKIVRETNAHFMVNALGDLNWDENAPIDLAGFPY